MLIGLVHWSTARSPASRKRSYGKEQVLGTRGTCTQKAHLTSPHQDFSLVPLRSVNDPVWKSELILHGYNRNYKHRYMSLDMVIND